MSSSPAPQRVAAMIRGAFIADAASLGTHWIYDPVEMAKTVLSLDAPEFRDPPSPKFYSSEEFPGHYNLGMLSPYGEQLLFVTEHVATTTDLTGKTMSQDMLEWAKTFGGRPDSALKAFMENMEKNSKVWPDCGADDSQAHIYMKVVPVVGRYAGSTELLDKVTQAIKVHQNNAQAIAFGIAAARVLEAVLLGAPLAQALDTVEKNIKDDLTEVGIAPDVQEEVTKAFARGKQAGQETDKTLDGILLEISHQLMKGKEDSPFYNLAGRSCALPGSFIGPIWLFYKYANTKEPPAFAPALRENILASGDTCSRAIFIGAVLAAADSASVPPEWADKMDKGTMEKIDAAIAGISGKTK